MRRIAARYVRFCGRLAWVADHVAALLLASVVLINAAQIACRYVFAIPIIWSEETMRYAMVWTVFLAGSTLVLRNEHLATGWEPRNRRVRQGLGIVRFLLIGGFGALLARYGLPLAVSNARFVSPAAEIPMVVPYLGIGVGAVLMVLYALARLVHPAPDDPTEPG